MTAAIAAVITALLGIGSLVTNIPSGILATRIGERKSMLVAAAVAVAGLILCLVDLGHGGLSLAVFGFGVLLLGAASSVYTLARQSYLTEIVPLEMRARALSTLGGRLPHRDVHRPLPRRRRGSAVGAAEGPISSAWPR